MKILVLGAGATYAEAINLDVGNDILPPLMNNLAKRVWQEFNPHPYLDRFLEQLGYEVKDEDGREKFYELEKEEIANIEKFFEFCLLNREKSWGWSKNSKVNNQMQSKNDHLPKDFIRGLTVSMTDNATVTSRKEPDFWENMMYHGFGRPFQEMMIQCFHENGKGIKDFTLSKKVASILGSGDIVVNLNYDTVFELAIQQLQKEYQYCPSSDLSVLRICKPHGSLNMVINFSKNSFTFGQPEWWGVPEPPVSQGWRSFLGLIPPRFNKTYKQNPASKMMIDSIRNVSSDEISFWGVGLTESDVDLVDLFKGWKNPKQSINIINPDYSVCEKFERIFNCTVDHYISVNKWLS